MRFLQFFVLLLVSMSVQSDDNSDWVEISKIATGWGGEGLYITSSQIDSVDGCAGGRYFVSQETALFDQILAIALSAYHSKQKVMFRVQGCYGSEMNAIAIAMKS